MNGRLTWWVLWLVAGGCTAIVDAENYRTAVMMDAGPGPDGTAGSSGREADTGTTGLMMDAGPGPDGTADSSAREAGTGTTGPMMDAGPEPDGSVDLADASTVYPAPDLDDQDPDRGWLRVAPADVGMQEPPLAQARDYALQASGAGLISRHGLLVYWWGNIDERFDTKGTTESIGAIALALAIDDELVNIEDHAMKHLSTIGMWTATEMNDPVQLEAITLLQLATHTAGFDKDGGYCQLLAAPGSEWRSSDCGVNWLADTLTTVYAQDLEELLDERVWRVLGIDKSQDIRWRPSSLRPEPRENGIEHREFASGLSANVNALARIGLLYLRGGEWADGQRVFDPSFVELVRRPHRDTARATLAEPANYPDANHRYGVLWWTNATGALPNVPPDAYWAWGLHDSLIVVIPTLDLVIARAGPVPPQDAKRSFGRTSFSSDYSVLAPFLDPIVSAVSN